MITSLAVHPMLDAAQVEVEAGVSRVAVLREITEQGINLACQN